MQHHRYLRSVFCSLALGAFFAWAGCSKPMREAPEAQPMAAAPSLSATETFFNGALVVEANLGRGFRGGSGDGPQGFHGGPGGGHHRHGGPGGPGEPGSSEFRGAAIHESGLPPIALRLRLTNTSKETMEVMFALCKSELGDFAVQPEKLALAPGQIAEPEAMTSRLGLTSADLVLHLAMKSGGKTEQKDLVLRRVAPEASQP